MENDAMQIVGAPWPSSRSTAISAPPVLMYHSISEYNEDPFKITVTPSRFEKQMRWLKSRKMRGASLRDLFADPARSRIDRLVGLTFDDGYADFLVNAVPILRKFGFTATLFVVAGHIGGHNVWDSGSGSPKQLITAADLRAVAAEGMEVGSHSMVHASMPGLSNIELEDCVTRSRNVLAEIVGCRIEGFAYPYGHASAREVEAVRLAGYRYACIAGPKASDTVLALPRAYVGERDGSLRLDAKLLRHRVIHSNACQYWRHRRPVSYPS